MEHHLAFIKKMVDKGGPDPWEYEEFSDWVTKIGDEVRKGILSRDDIQKLRDAFGEALSILTVQGFILQKPHGYAGDYEIIEKIYLKHTSKNPKLRKWDLHVQAQKAAIAVRNRKTYFVQLLQNLEKADKRKAPIEVLNIASGPSRDLLEYFSGENDGRIRFDNVEFDPLAVSYAKNLCKDFLDRITFLETNAFDFTSHKKYRLIWSAGLFDYLNEKKFTYLLKRVLPLLEDTGEIIIGNFSVNNPTQDYMEILGEWRLKHRNKDELSAIGRSCGFDPKDIKVGKEPAGVNMFLHLKKGEEFIPHPDAGEIA